MAIFNGTKSSDDLGTVFGFRAAVLSAAEPLKGNTRAIEYFYGEVLKHRGLCTIVIAT
jgi:hypothetical protein